MVHDDAIDDRKSQASSTFFGGDIRLKQLFAGVLRKARTIIFDQDGNRTVFFAGLNADRDLTLRFFCFWTGRQRLGGIFNNVCKGLPKKSFIAQDRQSTLRQTQAELVVWVHHTLSKHDISDERRQVEPDRGRLPKNRILQGLQKSGHSIP